MSVTLDIEECFIAFLWDLFIKSHESKDSLIESTHKKISLEQKQEFLKRHWVDLTLWRDVFEERLNYLDSNAFVSGERPRSILFHERFGWILTNSKNESVQLGKSNFCGKISLKLEPFTYLSGHNTLKGPYNLTIGRYCSIAENLTVNCGVLNHPMNNLSTLGGAFNDRWPEYELNFKHVDTENKNVEIENDVWIGRNVKIHPGSYIASGCVIAEDSIVKGFCQPYGIYGGKTAKLIRFRFNERVIEALIDLEWWKYPPEVLKHYCDLFDNNLNDQDVEKVIEILKNMKKDIGSIFYLDA